MKTHDVVSSEEWLEARKELLDKEKAFTRRRDEITRMQRELPWEKVEKEYVFEGPDGAESLADLFAGRGQLVVYHFMMGPDWQEGCKSCSFLTDHAVPAVVHLRARDVTMVWVSRAPVDKIEAFRRRMGWDVKWVSSLGNDFNWDYHVSFRPEQKESKEVYYNYRDRGFFSDEGPGLSVFAKGEGGGVYHTYSTYERGLDMFIGTYNILDVVPKGRDEDRPMSWVRHHDRYDTRGA